MMAGFGDLGALAALPASPVEHWSAAAALSPDWRHKPG